MAPAPSPAAYGGAGPLEMGVTWSLAIIATGVIFARSYVSTKSFDQPGWDLLWAVLTYVTTLSAQVMQTVAAAYGIGNHQWLLAHQDLKIGNMWNILGRLVGIVAATLGKNSVIALLLRIQGSTHRRKAWFLHFVWVTNSLLCIVVIVVLCLRCRPIAYWWDKSLDGTCDAIKSSVTEVIGTFQGSWMAASDVALAIYPLFIFWNLRMSWKRKAGLSALTGGGMIAGVWGALKTVQVQQAYKSSDISYNIYPLLITTLVECWMILILASVPPLRPLVVKAIQQTRATLTGTSAATGNGPSRLPGSHGTIQLTGLGSKDHTVHRQKSQKDLMDCDNESEEEILPRLVTRDARSAIWSDPDEQRCANQGITVTRNYDVSYGKSRHTR